MFSSLSTTVSIPAKCVGREPPSNSAPSGPGMTVVRWPPGYMAAVLGANTMSTSSPRSKSTSESSVRG